MPRVEVGLGLGVEVLLWQKLRTGGVRMCGEMSSYFVREGKRDKRRCCVDKDGWEKLPANKASDDEIPHERDDCHTAQLFLILKKKKKSM